MPGLSISMDSGPGESPVKGPFALLMKEQRDPFICTHPCMDGWHGMQANRPVKLVWMTVFVQMYLSVPVWEKSPIF